MAKRLDIDAVEIRGAPLVQASDADVDDAQARLGVTFPEGYREFVTRLGEGSLNTFVRVLPPWRVLAEVDNHRGMMSAYWFWGAGKSGFGLEKAMESIPIADTLDGDVLAFHPDLPDRIAVLPRHGSRVYVRGPDLLETIDWVCSGGANRRFGPNCQFEPFDSRSQARDRANETAGRPAPHVETGHRAPGLSAREALLAHFADLRDVEAWALAEAEEPEAFTSDDPPRWDDSLLS